MECSVLPCKEEALLIVLVTYKATGKSWGRSDPYCMRHAEMWFNGLSDQLDFEIKWVA